MRTDQPVVGKSAPRDKRPLRGASGVSVIGILASVLFTAAVACSIWWVFRTERKSFLTAHVEKMRTLGQSLSTTAEALLAADEVSALRRIIAEAGLKHKLDYCKIILPDGRVIAATEPTSITLAALPDSWGGVSGHYQESVANNRISATWPLDVPGRGLASLVLSATAKRSLQAELLAQTPLGIIVALALVCLLFVYRLARVKLRAIGTVQQALLAAAKGQDNPAALEVNAELGPEAAAWNKLLAEKRDLQRRVTLRQAAESLQCRSSVSGDLGQACDALPQGLILVDENIRAKYANGAAATLLQTGRQQLLGTDLSEFIDDERVIEAVRKAATSPDSRRTIIEVERADADAGVLRFIIRPARREDSGVAMVIIEDITQKRVAEKARNVFLAQATHELRTPLSNIRLYVEMALEEGEQDPATRAKCLNVINEESRRLERVVSDILSVSEIEAGSFKVKRDDVRLDALLEQLEADYRPQAQEKNITLKFDLPPKLPVLQGDRDKITLALHNLLGNALKYTPKGGQVTVSISADTSQLAFEVVDTGIGIGHQDRERIFEKFYRAKNARAANITGSGMGLALAREIIRLHGGDITVESEPNRGSTFSLTLPVPQEAA